MFIQEGHASFVNTVAADPVEKAYSLRNLDALSPEINLRSSSSKPGRALDNDDLVSGPRQPESQGRAGTDAAPDENFQVSQAKKV